MDDPSEVLWPEKQTAKCHSEFLKNKPQHAIRNVVDTCERAEGEDVARVDFERPLVMRLRHLIAFSSNVLTPHHIIMKF